MQPVRDVSRPAEHTPAEEVAELLHGKGDDRPALILPDELFTCTLGEHVKPASEFYWAWNKRDERWQRDSRCKDCHNATNRTNTKAKVVNRRARQRATALLLAEYSERFAELLAQERRVAETEYEMLAEHTGNPKTVLRPGSRRIGEGTLARIDTAECRRCHAHHDRDHACPNCGFTEADADALDDTEHRAGLMTDRRRDLMMDGSY